MRLKFVLSTLLMFLFVMMSILPLNATAEKLPEVLAAIKGAEPVDVDLGIEVQYAGPVKDRRWPLVIKEAYISNAANGPALTAISVGDPTFMVINFQTWFGNLQYYFMVAWRADRRGPTGTPGAAKVFPGNQNPGLGVVPTLLPLWYKTAVLAMPGTYSININLNNGMPENWEGDYYLFTHIVQNVWRSQSVGIFFQSVEHGYEFTVDSGS